MTKLMTVLNDCKKKTVLLWINSVENKNSEYDPAILCLSKPRKKLPYDEVDARCEERWSECYGPRPGPPVTLTTAPIIKIHNDSVPEPTDLVYAFSVTMFN